MPGGFGGMPGGMPGGFGGMGGTKSFSYQTGGGGVNGAFNFSDPNSIFSQFFKQGGANMGDDDDIFSQFASGGGSSGGRSGGGSRRFQEANGHGRHRTVTPEVTILERPLLVSLEDLNKGTNKKMKITRKTYDEVTGKRKSEEKVLDIEIKAGYKAGTKIKFKNVGDQESDGTTQDMHFVITEVIEAPYHQTIPTNSEQKEHPTLKRSDDNLITTIELSLKESLTGWSRTVTTIDGRQLPVSGSGPTQPGYREVFPHLGMPKSKKPSERGDMIVEIKVKFPGTLSQEQKRALKEILS